MSFREVSVIIKKSTRCAIALLIIVIINSCSSETLTDLEPVIKPSEITKSVKNWLIYERDYMEWTSPYKAYDTNGIEMQKGQFLSALTSGSYLPVKVRGKQRDLSYQLQKLKAAEQAELGEIIRNLAEVQYHFFKLEGRFLPDFNFTDVKGKIYNDTNSLGKIIVINCWFINCLPCVKEIPDLNDFVAENTDRDIIFLGLAFDPMEDLQKFLKKNEFKYNIVPQKEEYLLNTLEIAGYPAHILIGKDGRIVTVTNDFYALKKELKRILQ